MSSWFVPICGWERNGGERAGDDRARQGALGLVVDDDGVLHGPRYPLVERAAGSYRVIERDAAGALLPTVFDYDEDPARFVGLCHGIDKALGDGHLLRAQLPGLQMPIGARRPPCRLVLRRTAGRGLFSQTRG